MNGSPFGGDMSPQRMARYLRSPGRVSSMMQEEMPGWDATPAEILADIVNVMRADTRRLAEVHDVDVEANLMTDDRAADLIAGILDGDGVELVRAFNEVAENRNDILREVLSEDEYDAYMEQKTSVMHTSDPDTFGWKETEGDDD